MLPSKSVLIATRRRHRPREQGLRDELAAALWELRRLRRENMRLRHSNIVVGEKWEKQNTLLAQVGPLMDVAQNEIERLNAENARLRSQPTDLQVYALRRVVMVQRREIMELREELARSEENCKRLAGTLDQMPLVDTLRAEEQWRALCAVADHEGAGMVEEFVLSGAPLPKWEYQYKPASGDQVTARDCMVASEPVLSQDWDSAEDNEAWAHLGDVPPLPDTFTVSGHDGIVEDGDA